MPDGSATVTESVSVLGAPAATVPVTVNFRIEPGDRFRVSLSVGLVPVSEPLGKLAVGTAEPLRL